MRILAVGLKCFIWSSLARSSRTVKLNNIVRRMAIVLRLKLQSLLLYCGAINHVTMVTLMAEAHLVLIQPFPLSFVNLVALALTSIFKA